MGVIGEESIYTGSRSSLTPSVLMIHEIDPTVKIWPGHRRNEEPVEKVILFDKENSTHSPYLSCQLSTEYRR